jgi:sugar (pentulose or hexulose) kinase
MTHRALAVDLGAGSGRVILGTLEDSGTLRLDEIHRFSNEPILVQGRLWWDALGIYREILTGIRLAMAREDAPSSVAVDTWGVDFGLLDARGRLLQNPVCYRDARTDGMAARVAELCPQEILFRETGLPILFFNTSLQLMALTEQDPEVAALADRLLFMPDLFHYFLTGEARAEKTIASTSQLLGQDGWSSTVFQQLGLGAWLPKMAPVIEPGTVVGPVLPEVLGSSVPLSVIAVAGHDTESALAVLPGGDRAAFISCGTWALMGITAPEPHLDADALGAGFSNEAAWGSYAFLRNIMGLWLAQEAKRTWERTSGPLDWNDLYRQAEEAPPFAAFIDVDDASFVAPGDMPARVAAFCRRTGQTPPETPGAVLRCIYENLAFRFRETWDFLQRRSPEPLERIHLIGGGSRVAMLCRFAANACGVEVEAGPVEASAAGNLLIQFHARGLVDREDVGGIVRRSMGTELFQPEDQQLWNQAYQRRAQCFTESPRA